MSDWVKQPIMAQHQFFVDQAKSRLLSQFADMEADAYRAGEDWLSRNDHRFNPDRHDPGDFYERAYDVSIQFHQSLCDLHEQTRLSVVAGMFHQWDKTLRGWLADEIRHWGKLPHFTAEIWAVNFDDLMTFFTVYGWKADELSSFSDLDACRWVVNVHKHGDGSSLERVRKEYPRFLTQSFPYMDGYIPNIKSRTHCNLTVTDADITAFSNAIESFWAAVPPIFTTSNGPLSLPGRLRTALKKDC